MGKDIKWALGGALRREPSHNELVACEATALVEAAGFDPPCIPSRPSPGEMCRFQFSVCAPSRP
jgi:hypothetical protein